MRKDPLSQRPPLTITMCVGVNKELVEPSIDFPLACAPASSLLTSHDPSVSFSQRRLLPQFATCSPFHDR